MLPQLRKYYKENNFGYEKSESQVSSFAEDQTYMRNKGKIINFSDEELIKHY